MGKVILGTILGLVLGALAGGGIKYVCDHDSGGDYRQYSGLPVYKQNDAAAGTVEGIDIAPLFPTLCAALGCIVGAVAGAAAAIVDALRSQTKGTAG
jgi:hypothetical protein